VGRRQSGVKLADQIESLPTQYTKKPLLRGTPTNSQSGLFPDRGQIGSYRAVAIVTSNVKLKRYPGSLRRFPVEGVHILDSGVSEQHR
jgi:hypothetical protein